MTSKDLHKIIIIDHHSCIPKYLQLSGSIMAAIENGFLNKHNVLPSIAELSYTHKISRDTAEKGYKVLKEKNIVKSYPGKGYYVAI